MRSFKSYSVAHGRVPKAVRVETHLFPHATSQLNRGHATGLRADYAVLFVGPTPPIHHLGNLSRFPGSSLTHEDYHAVSFQRRKQLQSVRCDWQRGYLLGKGEMGSQVDRWGRFRCGGGERGSKRLPRFPHDDRNILGGGGRVDKLHEILRHFEFGNRVKIDVFCFFPSPFCTQLHLRTKLFCSAVVDSTIVRGWGQKNFAN